KDSCLTRFVERAPSSLECTPARSELPAVCDARRRVRKRPPKDCFTVRTYRRAICRACKQLFGMPKDLDAAARNKWRAANVWHPHELRHNAATCFGGISESLPESYWATNRVHARHVPS